MKNLLVKILFVVVGLVIGSCSQSEIEEQVLKPSSNGRTNSICGRYKTLCACSA